MNTKQIQAILYAFLAAVFYAVNVPVSKILLNHVGPTTMAALLYLGAGVGIGLLSLINRKDSSRSEKLSKRDMPFVIGMIVLDIAAPIFLMLGISYGTSANASLLGNFEIVATTVIALFIFQGSSIKKAMACHWPDHIVQYTFVLRGDWQFSFFLRFTFCAAGYDMLGV